MRKPFAVRKPSPSMAVALTALFIALGGTSYALASVPQNSVGTPQLKNNAVTASKIKNGAVTVGKIKTPYLGRTITVTATGTIGASTWGDAQANCPPGYQAIGGGVDPDNVSNEYVTGSEPVIDHGGRMSGLSPGQHTAATGWVAYELNTTSSPSSLTVGAVCAPTG